MKALGKHNINLKRSKLHSRALRLLLALCMVVTLAPLTSMNVQALDYFDDYKYALLTSDTKPGTQLLRDCVYIVTPDPGQDRVTIAVEEGLYVSALYAPEGERAIIHIPEGVTLELQGGNGNTAYEPNWHGDRNLVGEGGQAGLGIPEGSTIVVTGAGTLEAKGGQGGQATQAGNGEPAFGLAGRGGGGAGGGGAGIGIGGGNGGPGGYPGGLPEHAFSEGGDGYDGRLQDKKMGTFIQYDNNTFRDTKFDPPAPTIKAVGGQGGQAGEGGIGYEKDDYGFKDPNSGGGGGGAGTIGASIGTGGGGGGGGGGGLSLLAIDGEAGNDEKGGDGGGARVGHGLGGYNNKNVFEREPIYPNDLKKWYSLPEDLYKKFTLQIRSGYGQGEILTSITHENLPLGAKKQFTKDDLVLKFNSEQYNAALEKIHNNPDHFEHSVLEYIPPNENSPFFEEKADGTIECVADNLEELLLNRSFFDQNGVWIHKEDAVLFQRATPILTIPFNPNGGIFTEDYLDSTKDDSWDSNGYTISDDGMLQFQFPYITHEVGKGSEIPVPGPADIKRKGFVLKGWFGPTGNLTLHGTISNVFPNFGRTTPPNKVPAVALWEEAPTLTLESSQYASPITGKSEDVFAITATVTDADGSTRNLVNGDAVAAGTEISVETRLLSNDHRFMAGTNEAPPGSAISPGAVYGSHYQYTDSEGNTQTTLLTKRKFTFLMPETDTTLFMGAEKIPVQGYVKLGDHKWSPDVDYSSEPDLHFDNEGLKNAMVSVELTSGSTNDISCFIRNVNDQGIIAYFPNYNGSFALSEKIQEEGRYNILAKLPGTGLLDSRIKSPVIVYDNTAPVFSLPDGESYDSAQTLTVTDSYSLASIQINGTEQLSQDFTGTETQLELSEPGTYAITASDKAGNKESITLKITKQLDVPGYVKWNASSPSKANWGAVENATSYLVQLYKDDQPLGEPVSVPGDAQSHDFASAIEASGGGLYAFTVTSIGNNDIYYNSVESTKSSTSRMGFQDFVIIGDQNGYRYDVFNNILLINEPGDYTISMAEGITRTSHRIDIWATKGTVNLTLSNVRIQSKKQCIWFKNGTPADVNLTLQGENSLISTGSTAIQKSSDSTDANSTGTLTIREHTDGGSLSVQGMDHAIGGRVDNTEKGSELYNVVFESGDITAFGAKQAFGSAYTKDHTATGGNVNVRIAPSAMLEAQLSFGDNAINAVPLDQPITREYEWTKTANYVQISYAERKITSIDITWGMLEFTYQEPCNGMWNTDTHIYDGASEGGWSIVGENGDLITVKNTGNVETNVDLTYNQARGYTGISGAFLDGEKPVDAPVPLPVGEAKNFRFTISGTPPKKADAGLYAVGTVTVKIEDGNQ